MDNKIKKFIDDPDWILIENMILEYIEPLTKIEHIDTKKTNDEIATEVRSKQIVYEQLTKFLRDSRLVGKITSNQTTFK